MHPSDSPESHDPEDDDDPAGKAARLDAIKRFLRLPPYDEDLPPPRLLPIIPGYPSPKELWPESSAPDEPSTEDDTREGVRPVPLHLWPLVLQGRDLDELLQGGGTETNSDSDTAAPSEQSSEKRGK